MSELHPVQIGLMDELESWNQPPGTGNYYAGVIAARSLVENKREIHLRKMLFNLRLSLTEGPLSLFYKEEYCFRDDGLAWFAFHTWDGTGDPVGWFKHVGRQRYAQEAP